MHTRGSLAALLAVLLALGLLAAPQAGHAVDLADVPLREAARRAGPRAGVLGDLRGGAEDALTAREFELVVAHGFSWNVIHPERDVWDFTYADQVVELAEAQGLSGIGMHFVWDQPSISRRRRPGSSTSWRRSSRTALRSTSSACRLT